MTLKTNIYLVLSGQTIIEESKKILKALSIITTILRINSPPYTAIYIQNTQKIMKCFLEPKRNVLVLKMYPLFSFPVAPP